MLSIESYDFSRLHEISDLLLLFQRNVRNYPFEITSIEKCRERFSLWPQLDKVNYEHLFTLFKDFKNIKTLNQTDTILAEQQHYVKLMHNSNKQWYIIIYYDGEPYGGVFLFQGVNDIFLMQAICRFQPALVKNLLSESDVTPPKINDLLIPYVCNFAKQRGGKILYVSPLEVQENILKEKFEFHPVTNEECPARSDFDVQTYPGNVWLHRKLIF